MISSPASQMPILFFVYYKLLSTIWSREQKTIPLYYYSLVCFKLLGVAFFFSLKEYFFFIILYSFFHLLFQAKNTEQKCIKEFLIGKGLFWGGTGLLLILDKEFYLPPPSVIVLCEYFEGEVAPGSMVKCYCACGARVRWISLAHCEASPSPHMAPGASHTILSSALQKKSNSKSR